MESEFIIQYDLPRIAVAEEVHVETPGCFSLFGIVREILCNFFFVTMEDSKNKDKTQAEKTDEKNKQPAGKDKEKKEDQELVSASAWGHCGANLPESLPSIGLALALRLIHRPGPKSLVVPCNSTLHRM